MMALDSFLPGATSPDIYTVGGGFGGNLLDATASKPQYILKIQPEGGGEGGEGGDMGGDFGGGDMGMDMGGDMGGDFGGGDMDISEEDMDNMSDDLDGAAEML
jgi:hypothetical protein